ncbi:16S rRNA (cytidine(1402)-2'-O)-methyltransferase [Teredinibacter sp. KSP-S5-2]|uniref:16S rRNA (cytidine(1402)-2'-O)-methyltransferase n=1 Tax=Teredinibacter sp. KSP-S5-2 TaxID=3034506 RepID=UPI002934BFD8|nr:16S rRNA (cytidine(1402)-2'-O)-methyltransferase [Teredinibacter sp. KSP-S5-2]WNO08523.1 16S rRNA (cytidine(1402)-2'-O)-methyltransferase [Teredinibacter sp. KSP-S5-2]
MQERSSLYIVSTPIGNLDDITVRAINILKSADLIAAEDTRHSAKLMQHYDIDTPLVAYHDHSSASQTERILEKMRAGATVALISDAGTPLISDPGYRLVSIARSEGHHVIPVPGACAAIAALSAAGLPSDAFSFRGFPPAKSGQRQSWLTSLAENTETLVFYESPHRIEDSLRDMQVAFGSTRQAVLARELTKTFETFLSGTLEQLITQVEEDANQRKGEMVILVSGMEASSLSEDVSAEAMKIMGILLSELPVKKAASLCAQITGEKKNRLYQWALTQK